MNYIHEKIENFQQKFEIFQKISNGYHSEGQFGALPNAPRQATLLESRQFEASSAALPGGLAYPWCAGALT